MTVNSVSMEIQQQWIGLKSETLELFMSVTTVVCAIYINTQKGELSVVHSSV